MLGTEAVTKILREKGFKVTPQRLAVYDALSSTKSHPNAEMLYNMLQPSYPTMSLATVYKTMDIFAELGLIQVLTGNHPHIRCTECNRVDDIFDFQDEGLMNGVEAKTGYQLSGRQLYFFGRCPHCQEKASALRH